MTTLHDALLHVAERHPERSAWALAEGRLTFAEFTTRVRYLAGALEALGLRRGDRLSILSLNRLDYLVYHYATSMLGVILHVMNTRHTAREWIWAVNNAESSGVVADETLAHAVQALRAACPSLRFVLGIGEVKGADHGTEALVAATKGPLHVPRVEPTDPVLLIYTSGTTGLPKGCLQTQRGSTRIDTLTASAMAATMHDTYMGIMPYFHQAGLIRARAVMSVGGCNVACEALDMASIAARMEELRVTITMLVSAQQGLVLLQRATSPGHGNSSLRLLISGGGMGPKAMTMLEMLCKTLHCEFMGIWGQTECTGPVTVVSSPEAFQNPRTCGKPMAGIDLQIWDDAKQPLACGQTGEIMVRSPMTASYWQNPAANSALYTGEWLHTGDLGRIDEQGYVYFVDRKKDLIKTGGENVYPQEVEAALSGHPAIAELTVIGLPDPTWGEAVTAVIVPRPGCTISLDEVRRSCEGAIASYKIPKSIRVVDAIPKNETGKVLRRALRERFATADEAHS